MTIYLKELKKTLSKCYSESEPEKLIQKLFDIGVIDYSMCKVLAVRSHVDNLVNTGTRKTDAMWEASEHFCCSYEYIRKCVYYYTDVNIK